MGRYVHGRSQVRQPNVSTEQHEDSSAAGGVSYSEVPDLRDGSRSDNGQTEGTGALLEEAGSLTAEDGVPESLRAPIQNFLLGELGQSYWEKVPLDIAEDRLAIVRQTLEIGAKTIQRRVSENQKFEKCSKCGRRVEKWFNRDVKRNYETGMLDIIVFCSERCYTSFRGKIAAEEIGETPRPLGRA